MGTKKKLYTNDNRCYNKQTDIVEVCFGISSLMISSEFFYLQMLSKNNKKNKIYLMINGEDVIKNDRDYIIFNYRNNFNLCYVPSGR